MRSKCASSSFFFAFFFVLVVLFFVFFFCQRERETHETHSFNFIFYGLERIAPYNTTKKKASFRALLFPRIETFHWSLLSVMHTFSFLHEQSSSLLLKRHLVFAVIKTRRVERRRRFFCRRRRTRRRTRRRKKHTARRLVKEERVDDARLFYERGARVSFEGGGLLLKKAVTCGPLE